MHHDAPLVVGWLIGPGADGLDLLLDPVAALVRAFVTPSSRNPSICGHQVAIVAASRVVSGILAPVHASVKAAWAAATRSRS